MNLKERISLQRWITNFIITHSLPAGRQEFVTPKILFLFFEIYMSNKKSLSQKLWDFLYTIFMLFYKDHFPKSNNTNPTILSFSFGLLSAISKANAVKVSGVILVRKSKLDFCKNQTNANAAERLLPSVKG